jgi:hypothetical protein
MGNGSSNRCSAAAANYHSKNSGQESGIESPKAEQQQKNTLLKVFMPITCSLAIKRWL